MSTTLKGTIGGGGLTFTASPATKIVIPTGYLINETNTYSITRTITIPNGVKVIEVYVEVGSDNQVESERVYTAVSSNNKSWASARGDYYAIAREYVGVTPNKQYTVKMSVNSRLYDDAIAYSYYIKYSPEINKQTPTVTDY